MLSSLLIKTFSLDIGARSDDISWLRVFLLLYTERKIHIIFNVISIIVICSRFGINGGSSKDTTNSW
jgi:hypothetical protein